MMKKKNTHLSLNEFGDVIGLKTIDREMICQKNEIITLLKTTRLKKKISQAELAKRLGTKQPSVARMEAGLVGEVSFDFLIRAAIVLGVPLEIGGHKKAA
jgi:DNA-binding Xre family transcriptional regulator